MSRSHSLSPEQVAELAAEIDKIRDVHRADLGAKDARYIRRLVRISLGLRAAGRLTLMFGFGPVFWLLGVAALGIGKILENMEIGHNVMHGQYDWMNDPRLDSQTYEWDGVAPSDDWRYTHNVVHHNHTNVIGLDGDLGYGVMRMSELQTWRPRFKRQFFLGMLTTLVFEWGVGLHRAEIGKMRDGELPREEIMRRLKPFGAKAKYWAFRDYVLFPALAFWHWPYVLLGNLAGNLVRNIWAAMIIFCGHFPKNVRVYTQEQIRNETRGDWYIRQIEGSANIEGGRWLYVLSGHLSHQIEHHLFPDIPSWRYPQIAPQVRALCEKYGVEYTTGPFLSQYAQALGRIWRLRRPDGVAGVPVSA